MKPAQAGSAWGVFLSVALSAVVGYVLLMVLTWSIPGGDVATTALRDFPFVSDVIEVVAPGAQSSIQELPGRLGLWHVGVPPSGPMDARSFRHANRLVGNADETTALELTVSGPVLKIFSDVTIALAGARMPMSLDGLPLPHGEAVNARPRRTAPRRRTSPRRRRTKPRNTRRR